MDFLIFQVFRLFFGGRKTKIAGDKSINRSRIRMLVLSLGFRLGKSANTILINPFVEKEIALVLDLFPPIFCL